MTGNNPRSFEYTAEEESMILELFSALTVPRMRALLASAEFVKSGTKSQLRERLEGALRAGTIRHQDVVDFLDNEAAWSKQHIFLLKSTGGDVHRWRNRDQFVAQLTKSGVDHLLDAKLPLVLPPQMSLSQISHDAQRLVVTAVGGRSWTKHMEELDEFETLEDGTRIEWRAFAHYTKRGVVRFEWEFEKGHAMLQILRLGGESDYAESATMFKRLIVDWLPIDTLFLPLQLAGAIAQLHRKEAAGDSGLRSHQIHLSVHGRRIAGSSVGSKDPLLGARVVDKALGELHEEGVASYANVYWRPTPGSPIQDELHTHIMPDEGRVNFPSDSSEECIRDVVDRLRLLAR